MADKLQFDLVSPERAVASLEVDMVEAPGSEGIFGVLPGHTPFMSVLAPGVVKYTENGAETQIFVRGGFAEVTPEGLTILAEEAIPVGEFDKEDIVQRIANCEQNIADSDTAVEARLNAQKEIAQLKEIQAAL